MEASDGGSDFRSTNAEEKGTRAVEPCHHIERGSKKFCEKKVGALQRRGRPAAGGLFVEFSVTNQDSGQQPGIPEKTPGGAVSNFPIRENGGPTTWA